MNTIFFSEVDDNKETNFNGETMTFTLQSIKIKKNMCFRFHEGCITNLIAFAPSERVSKDSKRIHNALVAGTDLVQQKLIVI